jgi:hypothetical protein
MPPLPQQMLPEPQAQAQAQPAPQAGNAPAVQVQSGSTGKPVHRPQRNPLGGIGAAMGNLGPLPVVLAVAAMNRSGGLPFMTTQNRGATPPVDMRSLLGDIAGYLPGNSAVSATKASKVLGMIDELRAPGGPSTVAMTSVNPMERNMGLLGALGRNLPFAGAGNLTMISQMMGMVNTFRGGMQSQSFGGGGTGGPLGALSALGSLGNVANVMNTMRAAGAMSPPPQPQAQQQQPPVLQGTVLPSQNDIKDTVNRLLSGMDDRQKSELMARARQFLGQ